MHTEKKSGLYQKAHKVIGLIVIIKRLVFNAFIASMSLNRCLINMGNAHNENVIRDIAKLEVYIEILKIKYHEPLYSKIKQEILVELQNEVLRNEKSKID